MLYEIRTATITSKGQISIPKELREKKFKVGSKVAILGFEDRIEIKSLEQVYSEKLGKKVIKDSHSMIKYPSVEKIMEFNVLALNLIKVKKADTPQVLSYKKLNDVVNKCEKLEGDIYDKATFLLKSLVKGHVFASGNRRTAFIVVKAFLVSNRAKLGIKNDPKYAKTMTGIREGYYEDDEIKEWLKNGNIREFRR